MKSEEGYTLAIVNTQVSGRIETPVGGARCIAAYDSAFAPLNAACQGQASTCRDEDGDGYYSAPGCGTAQDCNDAAPAVHPGATEVCGNLVDDDCDGLVDEGCTPGCVDADGDGYFALAGCGMPLDCNDANPRVHPGAAETCGDSIDDDCDGGVDEGCPQSCVDADRDGYFGQAGCNTAVDCNEASAAVHPGAFEVCVDGLDNDCDGASPLSMGAAS